MNDDKEAGGLYEQDTSKGWMNEVEWVGLLHRLREEATGGDLSDMTDIFNLTFEDEDLSLDIATYEMEEENRPELTVNAT